jgi:hypothetical protein
MRIVARNQCSACSEELEDVCSRMFCPFCGEEIDSLVLEGVSEIDRLLFVRRDPAPEAA